MANDRNSSDSDRLQYLLDKEEITDVLNRYLDGIRSNDASLIASCFAEDAVVNQGHGNSPLQGREGVRAYFSADNPTGPQSARPGESIDHRVGTTPIAANVHIEIDGDLAHSESSAIAFRVGYEQGEGQIIVRFLRNIDDLVRTSEGWKIHRRDHLEFWQFQVPGTALPKGALAFPS